MSRRLARPTAVLAGVGTTIVALALTVGAGFAIGWVVLSDATRADRALAALIWFGVCALLAFAAGGWLATRFATPSGPAATLLTGLDVGVAAALFLVAAIATVLDEAMDFRSVQVALDLVDAPTEAAASAPVPIATPIGGGEAINEAAAIARRRTVTAGAYWAAVLALALGAAVLGGAAGQRERRPPAVGVPSPGHRDADTG